MLSKYAPLPVLNFQYQAGHYIVERGNVDENEDTTHYDDEIMRIEDRFSRYVFIQKRNDHIINAATLTNTMADPYYIPEIERLVSSSVSSSLFATVPQRPHPLCAVPQEIIMLIVENAYDSINENKLAVLDLRNMLYAFGWKLSDSFWKRRLDFVLLFELQELQERKKLDPALRVDWQRICLGIEALYTKRGWFDASGLKNRARTCRFLEHIKKTFLELVMDETDEDTVFDELLESEAMMEDSQTDTQTDSTDSSIDSSTDSSTDPSTELLTESPTESSADSLTESETESLTDTTGSSSTIGQSDTGSDTHSEPETQPEPQLPSTQQSQSQTQAEYIESGDESDDQLFLELLLQES